MAATLQNMTQKTAAVLGATGLVGSWIVNYLKEENEFPVIRMIVRQPVKITHPKVEVKLVNFDDAESVKLAIDGCDVVFCAVGTTNKKVKGDKAAYRKTDYDIPVQAARFCVETGCNQFLLVSAVGANSRSTNFYLMLKGEVEDAVKSFQIKSLSFFRPSVLLGKRAATRPGEKIAQSLAKFFSFLLVGRWDKYQPIDVKLIAKAMVQAAKENKPGIETYEFTDMQYLAKKFRTEKV
ncbi:MAG: NAD(P)H-binding protein [Bacteroidota bacterium]|nr:NAD(P)H-binding protein [Bacteroidota bacterium]